MYVTCTYYAIVHTRHINGEDMYIIFWKCIDMSIQFLKCIKIYVHGIYMEYTFEGINMNVHCSDVYVHAYTSMYAF